MIFRIEVEDAIDHRALLRVAVEHDIADGAGRGVEEAFDQHVGLGHGGASGLIALTTVSGGPGPNKTVAAGPTWIKT